MAGTVNSPDTPVDANTTDTGLTDPVAMSAIKLKIQNKIPLTQEEATIYAKNPDNRVNFRNSADMASKLMFPKSLTGSVSDRIAAKSGRSSGPNGV